MAAIADTSRGRQLQKLAGALPGGNQQVQQGLDQARQVRLQQQIKQLTPSAGTAAAQQLGAQQTAQAGAIQQQAAQAQATQGTQLGQLALQEQSRSGRQVAFGQQIELGQQEQVLANKLSQISRTYKTKLLDEQLTFNKDQAGNTLFKTRQAMDWALSKSKSQEEWNNYVQEAKKVDSRRMAMLAHVNKELSQVLEQGYLKEGKKLDQASRLKIAKYLSETRAELEKSKTSAANKSSMLQAGGTLVGAGIGAVLGGPVGASLGATLGGGLASLLG